MGMDMDMMMMSIGWGTKFKFLFDQLETDSMASFLVANVACVLFGVWYMLLGKQRAFVLNNILS